MKDEESNAITQSRVLDFTDAYIVKKIEESKTEQELQVSMALLEMYRSGMVECSFKNGELMFSLLEEPSNAALDAIEREVNEDIDADNSSWIEDLMEEFGVEGSDYDQ